MSSGLASSSPAASRLPFSTTSSDACPAATPPIWVDFEPYVPVPRGTTSVSPLSTVIFSTGSPRRSATICAKVVSWPWPCDSEPVRTVASPAGVISTAPNSCSEMPLVTSTYTLRPIPSWVAEPFWRRAACCRRRSS